MGSILADGQGHLFPGGGEIVTVVPEQGQSPKVIAQPNGILQGSGVAYPNSGAGLNPNSLLGKAFQQAQQQGILSPVSQPQSMLPMGITNAKPQTQTQMLSQSPQMRQTILANKLATLKQNNPQQYSQIVQKVRAQKARGGRVGYADGSQPQINQQQVAMIVTMLKKGTDLDTIASVTGVPAQAIQMIVSKLQQGIQQKAKGGITEIDYRDKGGYVPPIGKKERADDIPAMLSNNEFVFTANAVRNAGGGDVKAGAKKMYALMKQLEKGMA